MSAVCLPGCMTQPTYGGSMDSGAAQAIGAAFASPLQLVVAIATTPGFSSRRASVG